MMVHVIRPGENLEGIGQNYGVSAMALAEANQLTTPDICVPGQALSVPGEQEIVHRMVRGETLAGIARAYGLPLAALHKANPSLHPGGQIPLGFRLRIPCCSDFLDPVMVCGCFSETSRAVWRASAPYLTWSVPACSRVDETGALLPGTPAPWEKGDALGTGRLLAVRNRGEDGRFSGELAHGLLTDRETQTVFFESLMAALAAGAWDGLLLDLESLFPYDREPYTQFLERLAERLHAWGYLFLTVLPPKRSAGERSLLAGAYDYAAHGRTADYVALLSGDWGDPLGPAGAMAPMDALREVLDYAVSAIPGEEKLLLGIPDHGCDWTLPFRQGNAARQLTHPGATALAGAVGAEIRYDAAAESPFFHYTDSDGKRHEVRFEDARSLLAKYRLLREYGLGGFFFRNLDSLYRTNFLALESMYHVRKLY